MENMTVKQLRVELESRKLPTSGTKRILINRIMEFDGCQIVPDHELIQTESQTSAPSVYINLADADKNRADVLCNANISSSALTPVNDEEIRAREWDVIRREKNLIELERNLMRREREVADNLRLLEQGGAPVDNTAPRPKINCSIREIADALPVFLPGEIFSMSSDCWINTVETLTKIYEWDEKALILAAASRMKGPARYWWDTAGVAFTSWSELANGLRSNFPQQHSEIEIHKQLSTKVRKSTETIDNYCFEMNMLGKKIQLSDKAIIQYILTGLNDSLMSSSLAAGSFRDIAELIEKIKWFESIRGNVRQSLSSGSKPINSIRHTPAAQTNWQPRTIIHRGSNKVTCYNCHQIGHYARQCTQTRKRTFVANRENRPPIRDEKSAEKKFRVNVVKNDCYHKEVVIKGKKYMALLDSGSERSLITETVSKEIATCIDKCDITLHGFGGGSCKTTGSISCHIQIDNAIFSVCVLVVTDDSLSESVLIGKDVLNNPSCGVSKKGDTLTVKRKEQELRQCFDIKNIVAGARKITVDDIRASEKINSEALVQLLNRYRKCIAMNKMELGRTSLVEMEINLVKQEPIVNHPYKVPYAKRQILTSMVSELLLSGVIKESQSDFASPVILVKKKNGEERMCVDYRRLNSLTKKVRFPMPLIDEQLNDLVGYKYFIALDLASGYYQMPIKKEHQHYTAFITPDGLYEFVVVPFGLVNAPSLFQKLMNSIVQKMRPHKIVCYMDDIVIPVKSFEDGMSKLEQFLKILDNANLTLNLKKCEFFKTQIEFLGHEIKDGTVQPGKAKTLAVENFKTPINEHEVRQFIGLTSYFRKFIENYSLIALPLTNLTRKGCKFEWKEREEAAFQELKRRLSNRPILALYNQLAQHELHTDASSRGIAGVLLQKDDKPLRPVAYYSRKTTKEEMMYHSYELEALAVVEATHRFRQYLLGKQFLVVTDCQALKTAMKKKELVPRIARWWLRMQEFDYDIQHRPGKQMAHVDSLSRNPFEEPQPSQVVDMNVLKITIDEPDWLYSIQLQDPEITNIINVLGKPPKNEAEKQSHKDYTLSEGRLYRQVDGELRLFIPKGVRNRVLRYSHDLNGHFSEKKTLKHLKARYWFPRITQFVRKYIKACVECAYNKREVQPRGKIHMIAKESVPFDTAHMDHLGPFVKSTKGNHYIVVLVDAFTKYVILKALPNTQTKPVLNFLTEVFYTFGTPRRIVTDRGTAFTSKLFQDFAKNNGIHHVLNATRTPRANGQVERYNRTILHALLTSVEDENKWDQQVKVVQWAINNTVNEATGKTAHQLMMGYIPRDPLKDALLQGVDLNQNLQNIDELRDEAASTILKTQSSQERNHNSKHREAKSYKVGDLVMLLNDAPSSTGTSRKLEPRYRGPYLVTTVLPHDRYQVADMPFAPRSQKPYSAVWSADRMKKWIELDVDSDFDEDDEEIRMDESVADQKEK